MTTAVADCTVPLHSAPDYSAESFGLRCVGDLARAEKVWREFEKTAIASAYQRFDFLSAWYRHVGRREGVEPLIVIGECEGKTAFIWPLGVTAHGPWRVARWLGGKHANYNLGLYAHRAMAGLDRPAIEALLARVAGLVGRIDAFELLNQPESWQGIANPFAALPSQPSPSFAYATRLHPDFETFLTERRSAKARKKLRNKERRLGELDGYRCAMAETAEETRRALEAFALQKAVRFSEKGIINPFAEPGVMDFYQEVAARSVGSDDPAFRIGYVEIGGAIQAMFGGVVNRDRCSGNINSFAMDELAKYSPGEIGLMRLMRDACEHGCTWFDLGVGEADYKDAWCDITEPMIDCFAATTAAGQVYVQITGLRQRVKRSIKQNPVAWQLIGRLRRARSSGETAEAAGSDD